MLRSVGVRAGKARRGALGRQSRCLLETRNQSATPAISTEARHAGQRQCPAICHRREGPPAPPAPHRADVDRMIGGRQGSCSCRWAPARLREPPRATSRGLLPHATGPRPSPRNGGGRRSPHDVHDLRHRAEAGDGHPAARGAPRGRHGGAHRRSRAARPGRTGRSAWCPARLA
jgi:hypothetical protein